MTKINIVGKQAKITIPTEIIDLTGWSKETEIILMPYIEKPDLPVNEDTPILIKKIKKGKGEDD